MCWNSCDLMYSTHTPAVNTTPLHYAAYSGVEEDLMSVLASDGSCNNPASISV